MNDWKKYVLGVVLCCACLVFNACRTVTVLDTSKTDLAGIEVMETQTDIAVSGKELSATIDVIKTITDSAKDSGELTKEKVIKVIEYVDKSSSQVKSLNETISKQTAQISMLEKSRVNDNYKAEKAIAYKQGEIDKEKIKASIFLRWALIATGIALILAGILWLPKLLKLIL